MRELNILDYIHGIIFKGWNRISAFYIIMILLISGHVFGQIPSSPEVSILSPKAASILRYGEYPVSLHTGLVDISVPIYTIQASGITIPIQLKYHASGFKYDDTSNEVGMGWTLMAGGVVSKSVMGTHDNSFQSFSREVHTFAVGCDDPGQLDYGYEWIREVENGQNGSTVNSGVGKRDGEMDMYSFNFLHHSGSFCFPFIDSEVVQGTRPSTGGLFIPANGMKANLVYGNQAIEIRDTDGIFYKFEVKDVDQNTNFKEYYLTQVIPADKSETITFTYDVMNGSQYIRKPLINFSTKIWQTHAANPNQYSWEESGGTFQQSLRPPRLTRIDFRDGYVTFHYSGNTWDLLQIKIFSLANNSLIQTIDLAKTTLSTGEKMLDKVTFSAFAAKSYDYRFDYFQEPFSLFGSNPKGFDFWGYFNGQSVNNGYVPNNFPELHVAVPVTSKTNRSSNANVARRGILETIYYPTKGWTKFIYEGHKARYSLGTAITDMGGLRISQIENYQSDGTLAEKKLYKYGEGESGYGVANAYPQLRDFTSPKPIIQIEQGEPIRYMNYTHYSCFPKVNYFISGSSTVYPEVTEYTTSASGDYGKTVHRYEVFFDERLPEYADTYRWNSPTTHLRTNGWKSGNLFSKQVYKKEAGTYKLVYSLQNNYIDINQAEFRNVRASIYTNFAYDTPDSSNPDLLRHFCSFGVGIPLQDMWAMTLNPDPSPYDYYNFFTSTGLRVLNWSTEMQDGVAITTHYNTYNATGLPTQYTETASTGDVTTTSVKYPNDFNYSPYTDMLTENMLTPVIEKTTLKNGLPIKKEKTGYGYWSPGFIAPSSYGEAFGYDNPVIRATFNYDGKRNVREISRIGDIKDVYLWGYSNRHPIAVIKGTTYDIVAGILGQTLIDRVANAITPAPADLTAINNLRTSLPAANIMTYTYQPLIGLTSQTDSNGFRINYHYDGFGRLKLTRDHSGNILQVYDYQYKE